MSVLRMSWMYAYAQAEKGSTRCAFLVSAETTSAARLPRLVPQTAFTAAARQDRSKGKLGKVRRPAPDVIAGMTALSITRWASS